MDDSGATEHHCHGGCSRSATDELRVPFWIVLSGVGVGALWMLIGVAVGHALARRAPRLSSR